MNREQAFLVLLVALTALASLLILLPFLEYVLAALLLGYVLRPLHRRTMPYLGCRIGAIATIAAALVALILPLLYVGNVIYRDVRNLATGDTGLQLATVERELTELTGREFELAATTEDLGSLLSDALFGNATELFSFVTTVGIGLTLVLFLVYYVLVDGPAFVQWAIDVVPMDDAVAHQLAARMDRMTWGVVAGHIFVAFVQGLVGGFGMWYAGVPNVGFWSFVMILTALLPIVGAFLVWGPATAYLYLVGDVGAATFLALWGLIVVSLVDNYLRSIAIDHSAEVNPGVILVGVVGGIYTLGAVGLFVGPIVIGLFAAVVRAFDEHFDALSHETPPPKPPDQTQLSWLDTNPRAAMQSADDGGAAAEPSEPAADPGESAAELNEPAADPSEPGADPSETTTDASDPPTDAGDPAED